VKEAEMKPLWNQAFKSAAVAAVAFSMIGSIGVAAQTAASGANAATPATTCVATVAQPCSNATGGTVTTPVKAAAVPKLKNQEGTCQSYLINKYGKRVCDNRKYDKKD
jgi:hypothetical protein